MKTTTKKVVPPQKKGKYAKTVERFWGGTPVTDATKDLRIIIKPCDLNGASRKDPGHCVFARACKRSFGTKKVLFLRKVAYVELPGDNGEMKVERFFMSPSVCQLVSDFDRGNKVIPHGGFILSAPCESNQLDAGRARDTARRKRIKDALLRGERIESTGKKERPHKPKTIDFEVRNGTGMVHFS